MSIMSEYTVETVALDWLAGLGWGVVYGPEIAPDTEGAERGDYGEVILEGRLHAALDRLNPSLPANALEDAFQRLTHPQGASLESPQPCFSLHGRGWCGGGVSRPRRRDPRCPGSGIRL